jgi:hypothetical protein
MFTTIVFGLLSAYTLFAGVFMANAVNPDLDLPSLQHVVDKAAKR